MCGAQIENVMVKLNQKNSPQCILYKLTGVDVNKINGFALYRAEAIRDCGDDTAKWPTDKHFVSWFSLSLGNKKSGDKILSSKKSGTKNRDTTLLRIASVNMGKAEMALTLSIEDCGQGSGKKKLLLPRRGKLPSYSTPS